MPLTPDTIVRSVNTVEASYAFNPPQIQLNQGYLSALWGYTSNTAPVWGTTAVIDGTGANGTVPMADIIPEPTTLGIWSALGALAVTGVWWRRRKGR